MAESFVMRNKEGEIYAWGWNEHGNLGTGDKTDRYNPTHIEAPTVVNIAAGGAFFILYL